MKRASLAAAIVIALAVGGVAMSAITASVLDQDEGGGVNAPASSTEGGDVADNISPLAPSNSIISSPDPPYNPPSIPCSVFEVCVVGVGSGGIIVDVPTMCPEGCVPNEATKDLLRICDLTPNEVDETPMVGVVAKCKKKVT